MTPPTAPYNFVRLPRAVMAVHGGIPLADGSQAQLWKRQDELVPGTHSGWIDVEFVTRSSLFTRSPDDPDEPCVDPSSGHPLVPGSSVRGAVRTLVEILAFAKPQPVHEGQLVFRNLNPDHREGEEFLARMREADVEGGFIRRRPDGTYEVEPALGRGRVSWQALRSWLGNDELRDCGDASGAFAVREKANIAIREAHHETRVWVQKIDSAAAEDWYAVTTPNVAGSLAAVLVITGPMEGKHGEHVFLLDDTNTGPGVPIPERVWQTFHSPGQLSQFQELQYGAGRRTPGHLAVGDAVFFQRRENTTDGTDEVAFLGRSLMYRQPNAATPAMLVPERLGQAGVIDLAEAMFGCVRTGEEPVAIRSRVRFRDARWAGAPKNLAGAFDARTHRVLLSSPKPTMAPFYLRVDGSSGTVPSYLEQRPKRTEIRGHKLYWHRDVPLDDAPTGADGQMSTLRPVNADEPFRIRIDFDGLASLELGALLTALDLPDGCGLHLGGGQPLGLGSVEVTATTVHVVDRALRYGVAHEDGGFSWGAASLREASAAELAAWLGAFEAAIRGHAAASGEPGADAEGGIWDLHRMKELRVMLSMPGPPAGKTAQMKLPAFRARRLLPGPHEVAGEPTPSFALAALPAAPAWGPAPIKRRASVHPVAGEHVLARATDQWSKARPAKPGKPATPRKPLLVIVIGGKPTEYDRCTLTAGAALPPPGQAGEYTVVTGGPNPALGPRRDRS